MDKIAVKRLVYEHDGKVMYEWEQTIDEINVYVKSPHGVDAKLLECVIRPGSLALGVKDEPPFLCGEFESLVNKADALW